MKSIANYRCDPSNPRRISARPVVWSDGTRSSKRLGCTGALLDPSHVLIAAHCIAEQDFHQWKYQVEGGPPIQALHCSYLEVLNYVL